MTGTALARAHIAGQEQLRAIAKRGVRTAWGALPGYDREHIPLFVATAAPVVTAAQRQSVALTDAYLARALDRLPLGVDVDALIGSGARNGTPPRDVYQRPFVTVWTALKNGAERGDAIAAGLARAETTAATDVQLAMRGALSAIGEADEEILGYARVPDGGACTFCQLVAGQRYTTDELMPVHPGCGCGVDVITAANRREYTGTPRNDLPAGEPRPAVAVREHGELGPVLTDAAHRFTEL